VQIKLLIQNYGGVLAIGMSGKKENIEIQSNIFYNYKITNSEPIWLCDNFAYILTTSEKLFNGMKNKALNSLIGTRFANKVIREGKRTSFLRILTENKARNQISKFVEEKFLRESDFSNNEFDFSL
jgi:hypothetical protein